MSLLFHRLRLVLPVVAALLPLPLFAQGSPNLPGTVIDYSPASSGKYVGSPGLVKLSDGTLVASHDEFGPGSSQGTSAVTRIFRSSDGGESWTPAAVIQGAFWGNLFTHRGALYLLGTTREYGNAVIRRSTDGGSTWTSPDTAATGLLASDGQYHCAPMPVIEHDGRLWRAMERRVPASGWALNFRAGMMSVPAGADLLDAAQWKFSNWLPGQSTWLDGKFGGWLEGNAVVDPQGQMVNLLRVDHPNHPEKAAMLTVSADGGTISFDATNGFFQMPGGAKKFAIRRDPEGGRYWSLANRVPPVYQAAVGPGSTRNTLSLVSSENLRDWTDHGTVIAHPDVTKHGFQYVEWQFDGNDLIAASRTGFDDAGGGAANYHDANYLSFHRIRNFRDFGGGDLPGPWKHALFGHDDISAEADEDLDGFSNRHEYLAETNPRRAGSVPPRARDSALVALAGASGVEVYRVTAGGAWSFVRTLTPTSYQSILTHGGYLYGAGFNRIDRIDPDDGSTVILVTRNAGSALTAGWTNADTQQLAVGPDGLLYFSTAFGASAGQGVFRLTTDGTLFERLIPRSGGSGATAWELNNARGLCWREERLFVSSRSGPTSTGRPVYEFNSAGEFVRVLRNDLRAPQGLLTDGDQVLVAGYAGSLTGLDSDVSEAGHLRTLVSGQGGIIAISSLDLFGEIHVVTYQHGIWRHRDKAALTQVFRPASSLHASAAVLPEADPYDAWISAYPELSGSGEMDDPDGDGVPNRLEFLLGWNPGDGASRFEAKAALASGGESLMLSWPSAPDAVFTVRSGETLEDWPTIEQVVYGADQGNVTHLEIPLKSAGRRFYRVEWNH